MIRFILLAALSLYITYAIIRLFNYFIKTDNRKESYKRNKKYDDIDPSKIIDAEFEEIKQDNQKKD